MNALHVPGGLTGSSCFSLLLLGLETQPACSHLWSISSIRSFLDDTAGLGFGGGLEIVIVLPFF